MYSPDAHGNLQDLEGSYSFIHSQSFQTAPLLLLLPLQWFIVNTGVLLSGGEILPSAGSSQCTIAMFWFIAFLVGSLYAANLTASLAIVKQSPPFETLQQLADDKDYKILLNAGSVHRLLLEVSFFSLLSFNGNSIMSIQIVSLSGIC